MSIVTNPIILDGTFREEMDALRHLISHQNAAIDLLASDKRASLSSDIATIAALCKNGEILELLDYGDQISMAWKEGETEYTPAWNLCHESDEELEDGETVHGAFFEWDKTTPTGCPFDECEALYYFDGTEGAGEHYIAISMNYGNGWIAGQNIQFNFVNPPAEGDQLVLSHNNYDVNPTGGITWTIYAKGSTEAKETGVTSNGNAGTKLGETSSTSPQATNGRVNAPARVDYGYNRWSQSALRQRLNSEAAAGGWWTPQNEWDRPPAAAATLDGFLHGYSDDVIRHFKPIKVVTVTNNFDENVEDITYDRVFLASLEQMYAVPQFPGVEGNYWEYYKRLLGRTTPAPTGKTYTRLIKYALNAPTSAQYCFRRSAHRAGASNVWHVGASGLLNSGNARGAHRCAPSVFLSE